MNRTNKCKISHNKAAKKYRDKNKDKYRKWQKDWLKTPKGKAYKKEKDKRYRLRHRENIVKRQRIWEKNKYMTDPIFRAKMDKKRNFLKEARKHLLSLILEQNNICPLCNAILPEDTINIHVDHIYPRSKGGSNAKYNLQATHSECNMRKYNKTWED